MITVLALCDHAEPPGTFHDFEEVLSINQYAPDANMRLEIHNISHRLLRTLGSVTRDLLDIAAFVYDADNSVRRGTSRDVFGKHWMRHFTFVVPVRNPELWRGESVKGKLVEMLEFLTEDRFEFIFTRRENIPEQLAFKEIGEQLPPYPEADCVLLFSGGMDSLAGATYLHAAGRKPTLISHQSRSSVTNIQRTLSSQLRIHLTAWEFPHLGVWINRRGKRALEGSQRSRSFLFLSLGSLLANQLGLNELVLCENGITTFNLPRLGQTTGSLATRSTHPRVIRLFRALVSEVFGVDFRIETPFIWKTRAEVGAILKENDCADLLALSASCARSRRPNIHPHCGTCSQCVDRRFAVAHLGLDTTEELNLYGKDIFTDALQEGEELAQAMSPVRFALDILERNPDSFCHHYVEVYDAIGSLPGKAEDTLHSIFDLHLRFAHEVNSVMEKEHGKNWAALYSGDLPDTCLLMVTSPASPRRSDARIAEIAQELTRKLHECPSGQTEPFEHLCEEVLTFLFCEDRSETHALKKPVIQSTTDQGHERRDLVFENRATQGFWAEVRNEYRASGVIVDAKNYEEEIRGSIVSDFAKYLKEHGLGRFGMIVARRVPMEARKSVSRDTRLSGAIAEQKDQWIHSDKMIVLLDDNDLVKMLEMKVKGQDPTELLADRIFTLRERV